MSGLPPGIGRCNFHAGQWSGRFRIIDQLREGHDVRRVAADDASPENVVFGEPKLKCVSEKPRATAQA